MLKLYPENHRFVEEETEQSVEGKDTELARTMIQLSVGAGDKPLTEEQLVHLVMGYLSPETMRKNKLGAMAYKVNQLRKQLPIAAEEHRPLISAKITEIMEKIQTNRPPAPILEMRGRSISFVNHDEITHRLRNRMDISSHDDVRSLKRREVLALIKEEINRREGLYIRPEPDDVLPREETTPEPVNERELRRLRRLRRG